MPDRSEPFGNRSGTAVTCVESAERAKSCRRKIRQKHFGQGAYDWCPLTGEHLSPPAKVARERIHWDHEAASRLAPKGDDGRFDLYVVVNRRCDRFHFEQPGRLLECGKVI
jgi:hypothetical protein